MKKYISIILAAIMSVICLTACADKNNDSEKTGTDSEKLSIVTTIFPEYDWVKQILGDLSSADVTMLLDSGVDLHSYQPTVEDISKISSCDLFIYVGGESDTWAEDAVKEAVNKDMKVINLLDVLGDNIKEEEAVEGMQPEAEEEHESEEDEPEYDEHVWLSLKNAEILCKSISDAIISLDPRNRETYTTNTDSYIKSLSALDGEYSAAVSSAPQKTVLFGDRFPFRYLTDDYSLTYYAAFVGCSAETEASFETISFLAKKVDELGLKSILTIEGSDKKIAEAIRSNTNDKNQTILTMNSMQATTVEDVKNGASYLSAMQDNLEILKEALQ